MLDDLDVRFHLTGGVVAAYYGDPRSTQDVDIVVDLAVNRPETALLLARLSEGYEIDASRSRFMRSGQKSLFQAIDRLSMIKIDFHVGEKIPGELSRSTRREIAPGLIAPRRLARRMPSSSKLVLDPAREPQDPARRHGDVETRRGF